MGNTIGAATSPDPRAVFVVHGRNLKARNAIWTFLNSIGLHPIPWEKAVEKTGEPAPFVGQVLEAGFDQAKAVLVLLTGDDLARVKTRYGAELLTPQPRANVLFEAGMALARFPKRTVFVQIGELRGFSDIAGRHLVKLDGTYNAMKELARRLEAAGCTLDSEHLESLAPLGPDLVEHDAQRTVEFRKKVFYGMLLTLAIAGLAVGFFFYGLSQKLAGGVAVTGEVNSPVTLYFVAGNEPRSAPGRLTYDIPPRRRTYKVLYVWDRRILDEDDIPVIRNRLSLPPYPKSKGQIISDAAAEKFLHGNQ